MENEEENTPTKREKIEKKNLETNTKRKGQQRQTSTKSVQRSIAPNSVQRLRRD